VTRWLIVGRGHLGTFLAERLGVEPSGRWTVEMDTLSERELVRRSPTAVVIAAGKTELRWCEDHPLEAFRCNVTAPLQLFRRVRRALGGDVPFVHLSSGCVWDGPYAVGGRPFTPADPPTPACFYSWTKAACDAMLPAEAAGSTVVILRPRQVYSPVNSPRNTLTKLCKYPALIDTPNSMTSAETIARTVDAVVAPAGRSAHGRILNVYDRGVTSPYAVGGLLAEAGLRDRPGKIDKAELDRTLVPRRVDAVLHDEFFESLVNPPAVEAELRRVIGEFARGRSAERRRGVGAPA
jgi:dTDP-4-dehydrorhamnose reductase